MGGCACKAKDPKKKQPQVQIPSGKAEIDSKLNEHQSSPIKQNSPTKQEASRLNNNNLEKKKIDESNILEENIDENNGENCKNFEDLKRNFFPNQVYSHHLEAIQKNLSQKKNNSLWDQHEENPRKVEDHYVVESYGTYKGT